MEEEEDIFSLDTKGKGKSTVQQSDLELLADLNVGDDFEPSIKMVKMLEQIKKWDKEAPEDKVIIYSQFTTYIDSESNLSIQLLCADVLDAVVVTLLRRENMSVLRYDGKMSRASRDDTLARFKKPKGPKILIIR